MTRAVRGGGGCGTIIIALFIISMIIAVIPYLAPVILAYVLFLWWKHAKKQKNLEMQKNEEINKKMEEILNTPLEKFGDFEAEALAEKYEHTSSMYMETDQSEKSTQDIKTKFKDLKYLLDEGLIDKETYNKKKEELLDEL